MIAAFKGGANVAIGVDHPGYQADIELAEPARKALAADFA